MNPAFTVLDVAHPPRSADAVEQELFEELQALRRSATHRVLKIVHGYGSGGKGGATRETVRNWAFRQRRLLRAVIEGERYELFGGETRELAGEIGPLDDPDCGAGNPGITLLWVR